MISYAKSKEYTKLANQVPGIFNIDQGGNKVLNTNDLRSAGISVVNTKKEKYKQTLDELKNFRTTRQSVSKQAMKASAYNRTLGNFTTQSLDPGSGPLANNGFRNIEINLQSAVNSLGPVANELSTPIIKNKRRFVNLTGALRDAGSTDAPGKKFDANLNVRSRKLESLGPRLNVLNSVHQLGASQEFGPDQTMIVNEIKGSSTTRHNAY